MYDTFFLHLTKSQLRVFSSICSNFVVLWLGGLFITKDPFALTVNLIYATISWKLAVKAEERLEAL